MKILITGVAGFLGFNVASKLLKNIKYEIYGIDNFDDYYSVKLKKQRVKILNKNKKFIFSKIDITTNKIFSYCKKKKIRYSFSFCRSSRSEIFFSESSKIFKY